VVWHLYHVIFDPDVYPLNRAALDGRVSREWLEEEHPLDPVLAGHESSDKLAAHGESGGVERAQL
jgi:hypothetical protein